MESFPTAILKEDHGELLHTAYRGMSYTKGMRLFVLLALLSWAMAIAPGEGLPDFQLLDPKGNLLTPKTIPKPAVIVFWASWCPVCKAEFPSLHKLAERAKVPFFVISREPKDTKEVVLNYMKAYPKFVPLLASKVDTPAGVAERLKSSAALDHRGGQRGQGGGPVCWPSGAGGAFRRPPPRGGRGGVAG